MFDQVIDFTDPVERDKRNWLKGACFVIGIVLSNYKKTLKFLNLYVAIGRSQGGGDNISFLKFEGQVEAVFQVAVTSDI